MITMWRSLSKKEKEKYHRKWIKKIIRDETPVSVKKHIVRHSKEIFRKDPKKWSASMRNLLDIFDEMYKSHPDISHKLERLQSKYNKNPKRYTAPPRVKH